MTGANRLLIGVAWGVIVVIFFLRFRRDVRIGKERGTELLFLALATVYAFIIPFKGSLAWYDGVVFVGLYTWYIVLVSLRPRVEVAADGPAEVLICLPKAKRRFATALLFLFAAGAIMANAHLFFSVLYLMGAVAIFMERPRQIWSMWRGMRIGPVTRTDTGSHVPEGEARQ